MYYLKLTREKPKLKINMRTDQPLLKIVKFRINPDNVKTYSDAYSNVFLRYAIFKQPVSGQQPIVEEQQFGPLSMEIPANQSTTETKCDIEVNSADDYSFRYVELHLENKSDIDISLELWYITQELHPFNKAFKDFQLHYEQKGNSKMLFSAPFGAGKTTFLKEFFNQNPTNEVFHLFPVNYSIASNEDIFKYIKVELLFHLLEKEVEFDLENFDTSLTLPFYTAEHFDHLIVPFVRLIPRIGENLNKIINNLIEFRTKFKSYHSEIQIDDRKNAIDFIEMFYKHEGSLFEDNFYTQIIRQLLEKIKEKGKKTVLILDDLDRIDPDHIFRLLNVFSAQIDREGMTAETSNKFGFDHVILVCHFENIKKIFHHRFGTNTDYSGYMDKFFSQSVYNFDSWEVAKSIFNNYQYLVKSNYKANQIFIMILDVLISMKSLTLREILKITKQDTRPLLTNSQLSSFIVIELLCHVIDIDSLIVRFQHAVKSHVENLGSNFNMDYFFKLILVDFKYTDIDANENEYFHERTKETYKLRKSTASYRTDEMNIIDSNDKNRTDILFVINDSFELLEKIAVRYKELNGMSHFNKR